MRHKIKLMLIMSHFKLLEVTDFNIILIN